MSVCAVGLSRRYATGCHLFHSTRAEARAYSRAAATRQIRRKGRGAGFYDCMAGKTYVLLHVIPVLSWFLSGHIEALL